MVLLLALPALAVIERSAAAGPATWQPHQISLTSSVAYPVKTAWRGSSIQLNATFTLQASSASGASSAISLTTPGFWDGGTGWKVRFAPPAPGSWRWSTSCSDAANTGLHGQSGAFSAAEYSGTNPLYRHGFLRPHKGGRYLEHADGTPFYWLGDTHWSGFSTAEHWDDSDNSTIDPGPSEHSMLREMVDVRAQQGYSVWKGETFVVNGKQGGEKGGIDNAGGDAWGEGGMYGELRPEFWAAIDDIVAYINSKGMVVSFAFAGIGRGLTAKSMVESIKDLARYTTARYAGYSTVWTTCQEYCAGDGGPGFPREAATAAWGEIAATQYALDPHKRSTSLHNCASNPIPAWRGADWYGHNTNQQSHFVTSGPEHWLTQYNASPPKVLIEDEANYEQLRYASMTTNVPGWLTRQSAWQSQTAGAAGYTYGGQGIWWACYNRSYVNGNCGPNDKPGLPRNESGFFTWDQCLEFPVGGHQLPLMAALFRSLPWHTLEPSATAIQWASGAPTTTQKPYQKADAARNYVLAYLPQANGNPHQPEGPPGTPSADGCRPPGNHSGGNHSGALGEYGGTVTAINGSSAHTASWIDPRSGVKTLIAALPKGLATWVVPASRPGGGREAWRDWVLLIEPAPTASDHALVEGSEKGSSDGADVSWVTSVSAKGRMRPAPVENGCSFVATKPMTVTQLCRLPNPGNHNIEEVSIISHNGSTIVSAHVDALDKTHDEHGFVCSAVATHSVLAQGEKYFLTLTAKCDAWRDDTGTTIEVVGGAAASVSSFYGTPPKVHPGGGGAGHCYGPLSFHFV